MAAADSPPAPPPITQRSGVKTCGMPEAEIHDLIIELRSVTAGAGGFEAKFDHLVELTGKLAEQVAADHASKAA